MVTVLSAVVLFTFRNPEYTFTENATIGIVYVDKIGDTTKELSVRVTGGKRSLDGLSVQFSRHAFAGFGWEDCGGITPSFGGSEKKMRCSEVDMVGLACCMLNLNTNFVYYVFLYLSIAVVPIII